MGHLLKLKDRPAEKNKSPQQSPLPPLISHLSAMNGNNLGTEPVLSVVSYLASGCQLALCLVTHPLAPCRNGWGWGLACSVLARRGGRHSASAQPIPRHPSGLPCHPGWLTLHPSTVAGPGRDVPSQAAISQKAMQ